LTSDRTPRRVSPAWLDALALAAIALTCLALRLPSLDRVVLNPDESQYEATASYLVATGTAPFLPWGEPGSFGLFALMTRLFGNYPIFELRVLVQLVCLGMAFVLYRTIARETSRWAGLAAGLVLVHYSMDYEGLSVNRDWFASAFVLGGIALGAAALDRAPDRRTRILFLSGLVSATGLWFKLQAGIMLLAVPIAIALEGLADRRTKRTIREIAVQVSGAVFAGILHLLPYAVLGTLGEYFGAFFGDWRLFIAGNETAVGGGSGLYWTQFFADQPNRPLLVAAYGLAAASLGTAAWRAFRRDEGPRSFLARPVTVLFSAYAVTGIACVKLGDRFFGHYYLLLLPAIAGLVGLGIHALAIESRRERACRTFAIAIIALLTVDAIARTIHTGFPLHPLDAVMLALGAGILVAFALRPARRIGPAAAALVVLELARLVFVTQSLPTPESMFYNPYRFDKVAAYLRSHKTPADRLFVWGWAPEIYSLTEMEAASHISVTQHVVQDHIEGTGPPPGIDPAWAGRMMTELDARKPRFIVDAAARSWFMSNQEVYRLSRYPDFALVRLLNDQYERIATVDGCEVYERRSGGSPGAD
jgi:Dolichyl-phosphate-mannose-protein mannosyltransferase